MICQSILTMFAFSYSQKLEAETADSNTTANSGYFILRRISHSNIFMRINLRYFGKKKTPLITDCREIQTARFLV